MNDRTLIRTANAQDLEAMVRIENLCFPSQSRYPPDALYQMLVSDSVAPIVIQRGSDMLGFLFTHFSYSTATIITIDVDPAHRRQGLGRALLHHALSVARGLGKRRAMIQVAVSNVAATALYKEAGFEKTSLLRDYYGSGADAWEMELPLSRP